MWLTVLRGSAVPADQRAAGVAVDQDRERDADGEIQHRIFGEKTGADGDAKPDRARPAALAVPQAPERIETRAPERHQDAIGRDNLTRQDDGGHQRIAKRGKQANTRAVHVAA